MIKCPLSSFPKCTRRQLHFSLFSYLSRSIRLIKNITIHMSLIWCVQINRWLILSKAKHFFIPHYRSCVRISFVVCLIVIYCRQQTYLTKLINFFIHLKHGTVIYFFSFYHIFVEYNNDKKSNIVSFSRLFLIFVFYI
jgi:hypothetical protein